MSRKRPAATIGPMVWEEDGPIPTLNMSKTEINKSTFPSHFPTILSSESIGMSPEATFVCANPYSRVDFRMNRCGCHRRHKVIGSHRAGPRTARADGRGRNTEPHRSCGGPGPVRVPRFAESLNASAVKNWSGLGARLLIRPTRKPGFPVSGPKFGALHEIDARLPEIGSEVTAVRSAYRGGGRRRTGCRQAPCPFPGSPQLRGRATNIGEPSRRTKSSIEFLPASLASEMRSSRSVTLRTFSWPTSVITSPPRRPLS